MSIINYLKILIIYLFLCGRIFVRSVNENQKNGESNKKETQGADEAIASSSQETESGESEPAEQSGKSDESRGAEGSSTPKKKRPVSTSVSFRLRQRKALRERAKKKEVNLEPLTVDVKKRKSGDNYHFFKFSGIGIYTPKPGFGFKSVYYKKELVWTCEDPEDFAYKLGLYGINKKEKCLIIYHQDGTVTKFHKAGKNMKFMMIGNPYQNPDEPSSNFEHDICDVESICEGRNMIPWDVQGSEETSQSEDSKPASPEKESEGKEKTIRSTKIKRRTTMTNRDSAETLPPEMHPLEVKIVTEDMNKGGVMLENDPTTFSVTEEEGDKVYKYEFSRGYKCAKVVCFNKLVWSNENDDRRPRSVTYRQSGRIMIVNYPEEFDIYMYDGEKWNSDVSFQHISNQE